MIKFPIGRETERYAVNRKKKDSCLVWFTAKVESVGTVHLYERIWQQKRH